MAKKRTKQPEDTSIPATRTPARKGTGRKPVVTIALPLPMYNQLVELAERNKRPTLWQARMILEDALAAEGLWPPPPG